MSIKSAKKQKKTADFSVFSECGSLCLIILRIDPACERCCVDVLSEVVDTHALLVDYVDLRASASFFARLRVLRGDRYGEFVQSPLGKKVAKNLGLPLPTKLDRFEAGEKVVRGSVLFGSAAGEDSSVSEAIATVLNKLHAEVYVAGDDDVSPEGINSSVVVTGS